MSKPKAPKVPVAKERDLSLPKRQRKPKWPREDENLLLQLQATERQIRENGKGWPY